MQTLLALAFLPLVLLGLAALALRTYESLRCDPAYFTEAYLQKYATASAAAKDLEVAIQSGDQVLAAQVQGARFPARIEQSSSTTLIMLWERSDRLVTYLYFDERTYERHLLSFQPVNGRWVALAPGLYQSLRVGGWQPVFLPAALTWWAVVGLALVTLHVLRDSERFRAWLLREDAPGQPGSG